MPLRDYSGTAKATTLNGAVSAAATSITVADATGYPTGAAGPFVVTIDAGLTAEEKVLCASRTGNTLAVSSRGWDGTTASDHDNAASVAHTYSATDAREANAHVNDTSGNPHPQYAAASHSHGAVGPLVQHAVRMTGTAWTFPTAYSATPTVVGTSTQGNIIIDVASVSTTSATLRGYSGFDNSLTTANAHHVAVGTA